MKKIFTLALVLVCLLTQEALAIRRGTTPTLAESELVGVLNLQIFGKTCTATLVKKDIILTAGHCVLSALTDNWFRKAIRGEVATPIAIEQLSKSMGQELTLIKLNRSFQVAQEPQLSSVPLSSDTQLRTLGFGVNESQLSPALREGELVVDSKQEIQYADNPILWVLKPNVSNNQLACPGDSGGPLFASINGVWSLAAINSMILFSQQNQNGASNSNDALSLCRRGEAVGAVSIAENISWIRQALLKLEGVKEPYRMLSVQKNNLGQIFKISSALNVREVFVFENVKQNSHSSAEFECANLGYRLPTLGELQFLSYTNSKLPVHNLVWSKDSIFGIFWAHNFTTGTNSQLGTAALAGSICIR